MQAGPDHRVTAGRGRCWSGGRRLGAVGAAMLMASAATAVGGAAGAAVGGGVGLGRQSPADRAGIPALSVPSAAFVLIDGDLRASAIRVVSVEVRPDGRGEVRLLDASGRELRVAFTDLAALAPAGYGVERSVAVGATTEWSPPESREQEPWIELTDGQVLTGTLVRATAGGERLVWGSRLLRGGTPGAAEGGAIGVVLDRVRRIVAWPDSFRLRPVIGADGVSDALLLRNGDLLRGFVEGIVAEEADAGSRTLIKLETDGRSVRVPYESMAQMVLQSAGGDVGTGPGPNRPVARVTLADGTSLLAGSITTVPSVAAAGLSGVSPGLRMSIPALRGASISEDAAEPATVTVEISEVRSIVPTSTRVVPLTSLEVVRHEPAPDRRRAAAPRVGRPTPVEAARTLGAGSIGLDGPCVIEWAVPPAGRSARSAAGSSMHVGGRVSLAAGAAPWGDCEVRLERVDGSDGAVLLGSARLTADRPSATLGGAIPAGPGMSDRPTRLRLTIEPGVYGAVRDAVVLEEWLLWERGG